MNKVKEHLAEPTAVRVALWRALHLDVDQPPHVLEDHVASTLAAGDGTWRRRRDMDPERTKPFRASIVARARYVEDLVRERSRRDVRQYVLLGAGLDTFAQRNGDALAAGLKVFEVDQPGAQAWKRARLSDLNLGMPEGLRFVPVDFESGGSWLDALGAVGFDISEPTIVSSTGVSMYISKEATSTTLRQAAGLAPGSTIVMSFMLPFDLADPRVRKGLEQSAMGAKASGAPWISYYTPEEIVRMAREAGFAEARHFSAEELAALYFSDRSDGLRPLRAEELLVAAV